MDSLYSWTSKILGYVDYRTRLHKCFTGDRVETKYTTNRTLNHLPVYKADQCIVNHYFPLRNKKEHFIMYLYALT